VGTVSDNEPYRYNVNLFSPEARKNSGLEDIKSEILSEERLDYKLFSPDQKQRPVSWRLGLDDKNDFFASKPGSASKSSTRYRLGSRQNSRPDSNSSSRKNSRASDRYHKQTIESLFIE
jgi:hypothetical protein